MAKDVHRIPEQDWIQHEVSKDCVCGPTLTKTLRGHRVIHHSLKPDKDKKNDTASGSAEEGIA
jgi:hypothetical protein